MRTSQHCPVRRTLLDVEREYKRANRNAQAADELGSTQLQEGQNDDSMGSCRPYDLLTGFLRRFSGRGLGLLFWSNGFAGCWFGEMLAHFSG